MFKLQLNFSSIVLGIELIELEFSIYNKISKPQKALFKLKFLRDLRGFKTRTERLDKSKLKGSVH